MFSLRDSIENEDKSGELDEVEWKAFDERKVNRAEIKSEASQSQMLIEKAEKTELKIFYHFDKFEEIEDHEQKTISTRWV